MTRSTEGKAQDKLIETLAAQGVLIQKWNDLFQAGITDLLAALPLNGAPPPPGLPAAMWLEVKATDEVPKRKTSPWWAKCAPRDDQMRWMREWNAVHPAGMVLFTPRGWCAVPVARIDEFFTIPYPETPMCKEKPTYARIARGLLCNSE